MSRYSENPRALHAHQPIITHHAWARMSGRSISPRDLSMVLAYGRMVHVRSAEIHAIGRREVDRYRQEGIDLSHLEGVQVVCTGEGVVITTYRDRALKSLRDRRRPNARHWSRKAA